MITDKNYCLVKLLYYEACNGKKHLECKECMMSDCPHAKNTPHIMTEKTNPK